MPRPATDDASHPQDPVFRVAVLIAAVLLLGACCAAAVRIVLESASQFDDAYMFLRYADNLLAGHGIAWNRDGIQTYGATSLLYLAYVTLWRASPIPFTGGGLLACASVSMAMLSLTGLAACCSRFTRSRVLGSFGLSLASLTALLGFRMVFLRHATTGMDTTMAAAANVFLIYTALHWATRSTTRLALALTVAAAYAAFLTRPDNLVYATLFPAGAMVLMSGNERRWRHAGAFLLALIAVLAADAVLKQAVFEGPLPLPYYAKSAGYYEGYAATAHWDPVRYLFVFARFVLPFLLAILLFARRRTLGIVLAFFVPLAITFGMLFGVVQIMGADARFYFPSFPFVVVAAALVLDGWWQLPPRPRPSLRVVGARVGIVLAVGVLVWSPWIELPLSSVWRQRVARTEEVCSHSVPYVTQADVALPRLGWWETIQALRGVCVALPQHAVVSLSEYGVIGASAPAIHIVDPLGLHDPEFAHSGFSARAFFEREPDLIWFPHSDYTRIVAEMEDADALWTDYEYYPQAFDYGIAIRRTSPHHERIRMLMREAWRTSYGGLAMDGYRARREGGEEE